jgi:hypothetical protein
MTTIKCVKIPCETCGLVSTTQIFLNNEGKIKYGRVRHYEKMREGKPSFVYHTQTLAYLEQKLNGENLNASIESIPMTQTKNGSLGQGLNDDLEKVETSFKSTNEWGCRLAWSRLVDLGSIDSGSNPGSPTIPAKKRY